MKVTLGDKKRKFVYDVLFGERHVNRIMYAGRKIWPDESERVATMSLDMSVLEDSVEGVYWMHALTAVSSASSDECYMLLRAGGRDYMLQTTFDKWKKATYSAGTVDFLGDGPMRESLRIGDTVTVQLVMPQRQSTIIGGDQLGYEGYQWVNYSIGRYVTGDYPPTIPNTSVRGFFSKGQKEVSTGTRIMVTDSNGEVLVDRHIQQNGHGRAFLNWDYGTVGYSPGSSGVVLTVVPHLARGPWGGYFVYPAFSQTINLTVIGLTFNTVSS